MRILIVHPGPDFSVSDVHNGLVKGLTACGAEVRTSAMNHYLTVLAAAEARSSEGYKRLFGKEDGVRFSSIFLANDLYWYQPDVLIVTSGFFITPEFWGLLTYRPHHVVLWCTESPYEDDRQLRVAPYVDTVVVNDPLNLEEYRRVNPRSWYFPHCYDPDVHYQGAPEDEIATDFAWVGTAFHSRIDFFTHVNWRRLNVAFGGNWMLIRKNSRLKRYLINSETHLCLDNRDTARWYRSTKVSANLYRKETSEAGTADGWAIGPREAELAACGTFFLREPRAEGDRLFPSAPTFTETGEFTELLHYYVAHEEERKKIAHENREAIAERTFTNSAKRLLGLIDGAPKRIYPRS